MAFKKVNDTESAETTLQTDESLDNLFQELRDFVTEAYEQGTTIEEAEKIAARCLGAQLDIAKALSTADLDSRMKKNGMKASKAKAYSVEMNKYDKKPSDSVLENAVALDPLANQSVDAYEKADAKREELTLYFGIFKDAHIYFRGIAKGSYT